jgi:glutaredoxin
MKIKIVLATALCLMAIEGITFSGTSRLAGDKFLVAQQETKQVELYVTSWCPYCRKAVDFFRSRGIYYVLYDIERDDNAARRKIALDPRKGVPFAVINGIKIHGFSEKAYLKALNKN